MYTLDIKQITFPFVMKSTLAFSFWFRYIKILRLQIFQHNPCIPRANQNSYVDNDLESIETVFEEVQRGITLKAYES